MPEVKVLQDSLAEIRNTAVEIEVKALTRANGFRTGGEVAERLRELEARCRDLRVWLES